MTPATLRPVWQPGLTRATQGRGKPSAYHLRHPSPAAFGRVWLPTYFDLLRSYGYAPYFVQ